VVEFELFEVVVVEQESGRGRIRTSIFAYAVYIFFFLGCGGCGGCGGCAF
jgi:hypothetical protein